MLGKLYENSSPVTTLNIFCSSSWMYSHIPKFMRKTANPSFINNSFTADLTKIGNLIYSEYPVFNRKNERETTAYPRWHIPPLAPISLIQSVCILLITAPARSTERSNHRTCSLAYHPGFISFPAHPLYSPPRRIIRRGILNNSATSEVNQIARLRRTKPN